MPTFIGDFCEISAIITEIATALFELCFTVSGDFQAVWAGSIQATRRMLNTR